MSTGIPVPPPLKKKNFNVYYLNMFAFMHVVYVGFYQFLKNEKGNTLL